MSNKRKPGKPGRNTHGRDQRHEWFGLIYVGAEVVQLLAADDDDEETAVAVTTRALRPVFDKHYEAEWPNAGPVPYMSLYRTQVDGKGPFVDIEMVTWPGERTEVAIGRESPWDRAQRLGPARIIGRPPQGG